MLNIYYVLYNIVLSKNLEFLGSDEILGTMVQNK